MGRACGLRKVQDKATPTGGLFRAQKGGSAQVH